MELPAASQAASEGSTPPGECLLLAHNDRTGGDVISMGLRSSAALLPQRSERQDGRLERLVGRPG